jgi:hypothetical protein
MQKPDYDYYLKLSKWSKKEAAFILCDIDPEPFRSFRFSPKLDYQKYSLLAHPYKLYRIFQTIDFNSVYGKESNHPLAYIKECEYRGWPLPDALLKAAGQLKGCL